ncbi:hypothetical protein K6U51_11925, partial [Vibrio fluvialis]|uniref:hypothetical protein n=1 Tax=Vibrio fluvialis TaxID=676 RepID=UPI001EEBC1BD
MQLPVSLVMVEQLSAVVERAISYGLPVSAYDAAKARLNGVINTVKCSEVSQFVAKVLLFSELTLCVAGVDFSIQSVSDEAISSLILKI